MSTPTPFTLKCDRWEECKERHDDLVARVERVEARQQTHGESIAALKVQVAVAAAVGSLVGGGLVAIAVSAFSK